MKKFYKRYLPLLAVPMILFCGCSGNEQKKQENSAQNTETETVSTAISFEAQDLEGNSFTSEIFSESKLTMVNVWATYCNPCLSEMPGLGELNGEYNSEDFRIIGIISDVQEGTEQESIDFAADLVSQTNADYPHLLLNESLFYALLSDVTAVPTTFFVNQDGVILDTLVGSMEKSAWEEKINALLETM